MTLQAPDRFVFREQEVEILCFSGDRIFHPADYGLRAAWSSTACYRGFVCHFYVDDFLWLRQLFINIHEPVEILGGLPCDDEDEKRLGGYVYKQIPNPVPFTGGILVGRGSTGRYVPLVQRSSEVYELSFESGKLVEATDQSTNVRRMHEVLGNRYQQEREVAKRVRDWFESQLRHSRYFSHGYGHWQDYVFACHKVRRIIPPEEFYGS